MGWPSIVNFSKERVWAIINATIARPATAPIVTIRFIAASSPALVDDSFDDLEMASTRKTCSITPNGCAENVGLLPEHVLVGHAEVGRPRRARIDRFHDDRGRGADRLAGNDVGTVLILRRVAVEKLLHRR